jgi:hypothetical protein
MSSSERERKVTAVVSAATFGGGCGEEGDAGDDAMGAAGEETEHAGGVGGVGGLAEDLVVEGYGGVGGEDGDLRDGGFRLLEESSAKTAWAFSRARRVT